MKCVFTCVIHAGNCRKVISKLSGHYFLSYPYCSLIFFIFVFLLFFHLFIPFIPLSPSLRKACGWNHIVILQMIPFRHNITICVKTSEFHVSVSAAMDCMGASEERSASISYPEDDAYRNVGKFLRDYAQLYHRLVFVASPLFIKGGGKLGFSFLPFCRCWRQYSVLAFMKRKVSRGLEIWWQWQGGRVNEAECRGGKENCSSPSGSRALLWAVC